MRYDLAVVSYERVQLEGGDAVSRRANQHWDIKDAHAQAFARAEVFIAPEQWGVRLWDRAPEVSDAALLRTLSELLVWHAKCQTDTVDVVLARTHAHHTLVQIPGGYV